PTRAALRWPTCFGPEHEVVDQELRAAAKQVGQRSAALVGVEAIGVVDAHPRQRLPSLRQLVAAPGELLLRRQQLQPRRQPFLTRANRMLAHVALLSWL